MEKIEKRMWGLIFLFFIILVLMAGCGEVCDAPTYVNDQARGETEASFVKLHTKFSRNYLGGNFLTVEHDGHLWVVYYGYSFQHSPDCPCLKKKQMELN